MSDLIVSHQHRTVTIHGDVTRKHRPSSQTVFFRVRRSLVTALAPDVGSLQHSLKSAGLLSRPVHRHAPFSEAAHVREEAGGLHRKGHVWKGEEAA